MKLYCRNSSSHIISAFRFWYIGARDSMNFLHYGVHCKPAFLQGHLFIHCPLQPQRIIFNNSVGLEAISVMMGLNLPLHICQPQLSGSTSVSQSLPSKPEFDDRPSAHDRILLLEKEEAKQGNF